jgi:hypothetical protein
MAPHRILRYDTVKISLGAHYFGCDQSIHVVFLLDLFRKGEGLIRSWVGTRRSFEVLENYQPATSASFCACVRSRVSVSVPEM